MQKNGTNADGLWEIYSGGQDYKKIGQLKSINGKSDVEGAWKGDCNNIKGSDGSFFPPLLKKDTPLSAFSPDVCRSVEYTRKVFFLNEYITQLTYNFNTFNSV